MINNYKTNQDSKKKKKKERCFAFSKKGKCKAGENCPFLHEKNPTLEDESSPKKLSLKKKNTTDKKDCINWKTKGKCRKGDKCPYKHDEALRQAAFKKKLQKKIAPENKT